MPPGAPPPNRNGPARHQDTTPGCERQVTGRRTVGRSRRLPVTKASHQRNHMRVCRRRDQVASVPVLRARFSTGACTLPIACWLATPTPSPSVRIERGVARFRCWLPRRFARWHHRRTVHPAPVGRLPLSALPVNSATQISYFSVGGNRRRDFRPVTIESDTITRLQLRQAHRKWRGSSHSRCCTNSDANQHREAEYGHGLQHAVARHRRHGVAWLLASWRGVGRSSV